MDAAHAWGRSVGRLPSALLSLAVTCDDERIVGSALTHTAVWHAEDGATVGSLPGAAQVLLIPNAGERQRWVALASNAAVCLHALLHEAPSRRLSGVRQPVAVAHDGRWLAARSATGVALFDLGTGTRSELGDDAQRTVTGLAFTPGPTLYVAHGDEAHPGTPTAIDRWRLGARPRRERLCTLPSLRTAWLCASPDGQRLAVGAQNAPDVLLLDGDGRVLSQLRTHDDGLCHAGTFSTDGERLALTKQRSISLWDPRHGRLLSAMHGLPPHERTAVAFCRDGTLVCDDIDGYRFVALPEHRTSCPAAGIDGLHRDAQQLIAALSRNAPRVATYRTSATPNNTRQADGAWQLQTHDGTLTLLTRARDGEHGALQLELAAFIRRPTGNWADDWATEHHTYAADLQWAHRILDMAPDAPLHVRRTATQIGLEVTLDCAPPPDTLRVWRSALAKRLREISHAPRAARNTGRRLPGTDR